MTDWRSVLFGTPATTAPRSAQRADAGPDRAGVVRLIEAEARRQGVDPQLAVAIARQESGLDPQAVGGRAKAGDWSLGLFQLHRPAAIDAGIDPERRGELEDNIRGGVTYFKQKLTQSGGNVEQALSRYNRGTPTYKGIGDPRYVENVMRHVEGAPPGRDSCSMPASSQHGAAAPLGAVIGEASSGLRAPSPPYDGTGQAAHRRQALKAPIGVRRSFGTPART